MLKIESVQSGSVGEELGLKKGDAVLSFDGYDAEDLLDYIYYDGQNCFEMAISSGEEEYDVEIEKADDETLGLEFEGALETVCCRNNCVFCFVSQLPKGLRKTLYVRDDDWRLSLITGNYVTLTNTTEKDLDRIIRMRMSPLYISVHATDPDVRSRMLRNPAAGDISNKLKKLSDHGIDLHCQIVLCPGYNDGGVLENTLSELVKIERVKTVAVVPVGMTRFREHLAELTPVDRACAEHAIGLCDRYTCEKTQAICSDEMYLIAGREVKPFEAYGDFAQIENGVGLVAAFRRGIEELPAMESRSRETVTVATGVSGYPFVLEAVEKIRLGARDMTIEVEKIENDFFGRSVTVTGLVTGGDIARQLSKKKRDRVVIPRVMLKEFEECFLDGTTVEELSRRLNAPIAVCDGSARDLMCKILGITGE